MHGSATRARSCVACVGSLMLLAHGTARGEDEDPRKIMEIVHARDLGPDLYKRLSMRIEDRGGGYRDRLVQTWARDYEDARKTLIIFEAPEDVRNTAFLSVDYDDGAKEDDQYLYLPVVAKPTKVAGAAKSSRFVGSDFSYSDLSRPDAGQYDLRFLSTDAEVNGEPCWVIESVPRTNRAKEETGYLKSVLWVGKDKMMVLRSKSWIEGGRKIKYIIYDDLRMTSGVWTSYGADARTMKGDQLISRTTLRVITLRYHDPTITDADFTEARLARGLPSSDP